MKTSVSFSLTSNSGFHTSLDIRVQSYSPSTLCSLHAFLHFPALIQVDPHELRLTDSYTFDILSSPLTIDIPVKASKDAATVLMLNISHTVAHTVDVSFEVPFHARYATAAPLADFSSQSIAIEHPMVFEACSCDGCTPETLVSNTYNSSHLQNIFRGFSITVLDDTASKGSLEYLQIPVADTKHTSTSQLGTTASIILALFCMSLWSYRLANFFTQRNTEAPSKYQYKSN